MSKTLYVFKRFRVLKVSYRGLCIVAVHAIEIVNSDVNIYQLLVSGFVLSWFSFQIFNMIIQICIMYVVPSNNNCALVSF
jgi:hypothetical protein